MHLIALHFFESLRSISFAGGLKQTDLSDVDQWICWVINKAISEAVHSQK